MSNEIGVAPRGYRLPASAHIGRVRLQVSDLDRSIQYYQRVTGLKVVEQGPGSATLGPADNEVIIELLELPGAKPVLRRGLLGLYHFAILLPDRPALGRFVAHLSETGAYAGMSDHLVSEAVYLTDPDGLGIEVYADRPRSTWVAVGRQIEMASNPLDVNSVIASAEGQVWTGAPAGTRIGHVHFHVGDIDAAEAFYHQGLGFDKIVWSYPGALFMAAGGYHHHVGVNTWAAGAPLSSQDDAKLIDWELKLPTEDADAAARSLELAGFSTVRSESAIAVTDPWGIKVRLTPG